VSAKVGDPRRALRGALASWRWRDREEPKRAVKFSSRDAPARREDGLGRCCQAGLTLELTGPERQGSWARPAQDKPTAQAGPSWPAVEGPVE
jgi:hypothetical protein